MIAVPFGEPVPVYQDGFWRCRNGIGRTPDEAYKDNLAEARRGVESMNAYNAEKRYPERYYLEVRNG